ncbi:GIY-YIG nuclease family protein [Tepidicaulis marinus]|uniref:GIY-YIG nuclease family protein n=1 Tax=Tepidicaulis marinus TaxID=1333998 RepID=UPI0005F053F5|nr:GIY-YIG nuclease family protein [Tepidicaulis marinus]
MSGEARLPCVYMLTNRPGGTLYAGVTRDVIRRVWEHKTDAVDGFSKKYQLHTLVYAEFHAIMPDAILREKQIKGWRRAWKVALIEKDNPQWRDIYEELAG